MSCTWDVTHNAWISRFVSDDCLLFVDKATGSGSSTLVGAVADMKECVQLVKKEYPDAMGASMDHPLLSLPDFNCYAHLDHMDNTVGNTKMVVCWMRSPLSTKDGYCKYFQKVYEDIPSANFLEKLLF